LNFAGDDPEQGVGTQASTRTATKEAAIEGAVSDAQLSAEMLAFVPELTTRRAEVNWTADRSQLPRVERVAALRGLGVNRCEIGVDRRDGSDVRSKPMELWVMAVTRGIAT
jgi:hypothetical protein